MKKIFITTIAPLVAATSFAQESQIGRNQSDNRIMRWQAILEKVCNLTDEDKAKRMMNVQLASKSGSQLLILSSGRLKHRRKGYSRC